MKVTRDKLLEMIKNNEDISDVDTSGITNMSYLFQDSEFNQDISNWNVSKVKNMERMFYGSEFNQDISKWNVSEIKDMEGMFSNSKFNPQIENCGNLKRTVYKKEFKNDTLYFAGCFVGNFEKITKAIYEKYEGIGLVKYLDKINKLKEK